MDNFYQLVYVIEMEKQCQFALNATQNFNFALTHVGNGNLEADKREAFHFEVFRSAHSFLTHASNISRLFWPPVSKRQTADTQDRENRAFFLRSLFCMNDDNCLRDRTLRDHLEHYDERLDRWRATSTNRNMVSDYIGPKGSIIGLEESDMMRWLDPSEMIFGFRGEEFNLQSIATEIDRLHKLSRQIKDRLMRSLGA